MQSNQRGKRSKALLTYLYRTVSKQISWKIFFFDSSSENVLVLVEFYACFSEECSRQISILFTLLPHLRPPFHGLQFRYSSRDSHFSMRSDRCWNMNTYAIFMDRLGVTVTVTSSGMHQHSFHFIRFDFIWSHIMQFYFILYHFNLFDRWDTLYC